MKRTITFIAAITALFFLLGCTPEDKETETAETPIAESASFTTDEDTPFSDTLSGTSTSALTFSIATQPSKGTVALTDPSTGSFTYTPDLNENGNDSFTFKVNDGSLDSDVATVSISITAINDAPTISGTAPSAMSGESYSFSPISADIDGDALNYSVSNGPSWASFDTSTGSIAGIPDTTDIGTNADIRITVNDGNDTSSLTFDIVVGEGSLDNALRTGDASQIELSVLFTAAISQAQSEGERCRDTLDDIYPNGLEVVAFPGDRADYFYSLSSANIPLHAAKAGGNYRIYSWIGEKTDGTRYAVLGANIFAFDIGDADDITNNLNVELGGSTQQLLKWLMNRNPDADILNETLTILVNNSSMKTDFEEWLGDNGLNVPNWSISTDQTLLDSGAFDLFIEKDTEVGYSTAIQQGKPVIVFENWIVPDATMLASFDIKWRWYGGTTVGDWDSIDEVCSKTSDSDVIRATLTNLENNSLDFLYSDTACPNSFGTVDCKGDLLMDGSDRTLNDLFLSGASAIRNQLTALDETGVDLFSQGRDKRLLRLSVLVADKLRETIAYPMNKGVTPDPEFYQAFFADHAVHYARGNNFYQPDLGDFSTDPETLQAKETIEIGTFTLIPTTYDEWTATGFYAPPGATVTVNRTDGSSNEVKLRFNMLRSGTSRMWNTDGYSRPKYMQSPAILIEPGQSLALSTPYGGPIYVYFKGVDSSADSFTLEFADVYKHPTLTAFDNTAVETFLTEMENTQLSWVDIKSPFVEIHSLKDRMVQGFKQYDPADTNAYSVTDVQNFISDMNDYLIVNNLSFAGFVGTGLTPINADVQSFCTAKNLDCTDASIHKKPKVQHINSDIWAQCGALCSGNPFDTGSYILPLGWGESHELGHNLQRSRLKIYDGRSGEVSNNIFPIHVNTVWTQDQGLLEHPNITRPDHDAAFSILHTAIAAGTPADSNHPLWAETGTYDKAFERLAFYIQLVYVNNSWDIFTKLYIMERLFANAIKDDATWTANKDNLGFSTYTLADADAIDGNDFMYVALSYISDMDHADYFEAWGVAVSDAAKAQVTGNTPSGSIPKVFYYVEGNKVFSTLPSADNANERALDGVTAY